MGFQSLDHTDQGGLGYLRIWVQEQEVLRISFEDALDPAVVPAAIALVDLAAEKFALAQDLR